MKRLILIATALIILVAPTAWAADVVFTLTIPEAYVPRLEAAVENSIDCNVFDENGELVETLGAKACLRRYLINEMKAVIRAYENRIAQEQAQDAYDTMYQDWIDSYENVPVE